MGFAAIRLIGQHLPGLAPYCGAVVLSDLAPAALLDAVFGFTRASEAYHFWFIRDLMLLMLVSPLLHQALVRLVLRGLRGLPVAVEEN